MTILARANGADEDADGLNEQGPLMLKLEGDKLRMVGGYLSITLVRCPT